MARKTKLLPPWEAELVGVLMAIHHDWPDAKRKARDMLQKLRKQIHKLERDLAAANRKPVPELDVTDELGAIKRPSRRRYGQRFF